MRAAALATTAILLTSPHGFAFDVAQADIIGLRLGMADSEVTATLRRQGYTVTHDHEALLARTLDGQLTIDIGADHAAHEIRYTLRGNGLQEGEKIEASVLNRFGPPDQSKPMGWCRVLRRDGRCPAGAASLTFSPETLTLVLRAGIPNGE
jgi:hypothetical protein